MASIAWDPWSTGLDPAQPWDQSGDDARALAFTSAPLTAPLELLGSAAAVLDVSASAAELCVVAKLADVAPNGRSTLVAVGWLDLELRDGPGTEQPWRPAGAIGDRATPGNRLPDRRRAPAPADRRMRRLPADLADSGARRASLHIEGSHVVLPVAAPERGRRRPGALSSPIGSRVPRIWAAPSDGRRAGT